VFVVVIMCVIAGDRCVVTVNYLFIRIVYDFLCVLDVTTIHSNERKTVEF